MSYLKAISPNEIDKRNNEILLRIPKEGGPNLSIAHISINLEIIARISTIVRRILVCPSNSLPNHKPKVKPIADSHKITDFDKVIFSDLRTALKARIKERRMRIIGTNSFM